MYLNFFGLAEQPFRQSADSKFLYLNEANAQAMVQMDHILHTPDGFIACTGDIGSGKTTLTRNLLEKLNKNYLVGIIYQTMLSEAEFVKMVLLAFGFEAPSNEDKVNLLEYLIKQLSQQHLVGRKVVLVVDESQNLSPQTLEEIRLLSDLEIDNEKILKVILIGQSDFSKTLNSPNMSELSNRVRLRLHINNLTEDETRAYVTHRITVAGGDAHAIFSDDSVPVIYNYTGGSPRLINTLCDLALAGAFIDKTKWVTSSIIKTAVDELHWVPYMERFKNNIVQISAPNFMPQGRVAKLIFYANNQLIDEYLLDSGCVNIGRHRDNDIQIDDKKISRQHSQIITHHGVSYLRDLNSSNGSYVNGRRVSAYELTNGTTITMGQYQLKYVNENAREKVEKSQTG